LQLIRPDTWITFISQRISLMVLTFFAQICIAPCAQLRRFCMTQTRPGPRRIRFEGFEADLRTEELSNSGRKIRLPQQSFRVLAMLLERAGELVTREELRARLWPAGTLVEYDQGLNTAVNRLREALRDSAEAPRFIETLPKRGYRFIAAIEVEALPPGTPDRSSGPSGTETAAALRHNNYGPDGGRADQPVDVAREPASPVRMPLQRRILLCVAAGLGTFLIITGALLVRSHRPVIHPAPRRQVLPFTSLPGQEVAPTFSPDGSQIAFAWNGGTGAGNRFDLYVKSLGSERLLRLTHQPSRLISPAWSPDGSAIAFMRQTDESGGIFVIPALGGSERSIVSSGVSLSSFVQISWSPGGRRLAYAAYGPRGAAQVYVVSLDSLNAQPLSPAPECLHAGEPAFSPDGQQLALICISSSQVYSVYLVGLPHGPLRLLATIMGYAQGLTWSADGSRLIFSNDPGDGGELWQLTLDGQLTQFPFGEEASAPAVAVRGGRMAYVRGRRTIDIWRADLATAHPEESATRLIYTTRAQIVPRYSPDGGRIAFQSNRSGSTEIWITDAQGADPDRLTSFNGPFTSTPSWCSDGRRIAFDSRASGISAVYIEDVGERVPRKVVTSRGNLSLPAWSADCRWIFASDGTNALYRFPSSGGQAERFTNRASSYSVVVADRLIFNVTGPTGVVLWTKPASGGPEIPLEKMPRLTYSDAWTATTAGIYYTDSSSQPVTINFYEFATRATRTLMTVKEAPPPGAGPGIAISPDGRWLLYTEKDEHSEIMLAPGE
jgi:Tol biopolymer transport system component/DNA-binding winged helix-turn-helix (wHTH) protein